MAESRHQRLRSNSISSNSSSATGASEPPLQMPDKNNGIQQQSLKAWYPVRSTNCVVATFFITAVFFVVTGVCIIVVANQNVVEFETRYDDKTPPNCRINEPQTCRVQVEINVTKEMTPPIFFYYKLTGFYQNHRVYAQSRSDEQLYGSRPRTLTSCAPLSHWNKTQLYPCGLIANSFFNDTFNTAQVCYKDPSRPCDPLASNNWSLDDVAWPTDKDRFRTRNLTVGKETDVGPGNFHLPPPGDPEMIVWMRVAAMPTFKKLNRRILNRTIPAGSRIVVDAESVFPTASFEKHLVIATTSVLGGTQYFLAWTFIFVGTILIILACLVMCIAYTSQSDREKYFDLRGASL